VLDILAMALASAFAGPDPQAVLAQAALAWEARRLPESVDWTLDVAPAAPGARQVRRTCIVAADGTVSAGCAAPDGTRLFFDDAHDPFRDPPGSFDVSFAAPDTIDGKSVYHLVLTPRAPQRFQSPLHDVWVGTDDYEVRKIAYGNTSFTFAQFGSDGTWWTQAASGAWGTASSVSVRLSGSKTIANVRVTPLCWAVKSMVVPFLSIERANHSLFTDMNANVRRYVEAQMLADDPGSPGLILARANLDWYSAQMYDNLARADLLLKASYERMPAGKDPPLDALRQRVQTLVDVERIATNQYASFAAPRMTSYRYWNSMTAEVAQLKATDAHAAADPPPPQAYGTAWLLTQLDDERRDIVRPAMMAADYCGVPLSTQGRTATGI
jgi:hypothetical protein